MTRTMSFFKLSILINVLAVLGASAAMPPQQEKLPPVDFVHDIRPILAKNCYACHGSDEKKRSAGLRLDQRENAIATRKKHPAAIIPGKADDSELIRRLLSDDDAERMPPPDAGDKLTSQQINKLKAWINQGAPYTEHWAFIKPTTPTVPTTNLANWGRFPLDRFILARLQQAGLTPSPEADKYSLLRRISLDLRGLPPSFSEITAFERDSSPDAYEKMVDRFLADPAYGERWARVWLDLARYADSAGYGSDPLRLNMWRYRDWVIDAFNKNMPYDQFTIEQLAGDLLPNPTLEQKIATAFHRNTMTNTEGGTDREEFRVAAVKDRINTTMQVWMGLTMGCAQCHSHKYDPISQQDYYAAYAIFNQTADNDQPNETPTMPAPTPAQVKKNQDIDAHIAAIRKKMDQPTPELAKAQLDWETGLRPSAPWAIAKPVHFKYDVSNLVMKEDGSFEFARPWFLALLKNHREANTITIKAVGQSITGLRIESVGQGTLPNMNQVHLSIRSHDAMPPKARFVRVTLPGKNRILSLAEVEVYQGADNVARIGDASQSSVDFKGDAHRAIDGNTNGDYFQSNSVTHTQTENDPWWEVKLPWDTAVDRIVLWNRTGGVEQRIKGARIELLNGSHEPVWEQAISEVPMPRIELETVGKPIEWTKPEPKQTDPLQFVFKEPVQLTESDLLSLRLEQKGTGQRLRVSVTSDVNLKNRAALPAEQLKIIDISVKERTEKQRKQLADYYRTIAPLLQPQRDEVARLDKSRPTISNLPVMVELPEKSRRTTRMMKKGNFLDPGDVVQPALPALFKPSDVASKAPANRMQLARWLIHPDNPLTARVAVNRIWAQLFGTGLVESEEDFGTQGDLPSHPELLDWLAHHYQHDLKWNTKALIKLILMSNTYRQSSRVASQHMQLDPRNRLLSRAPRYRLEAEMVRDQALFLSGLLNTKLGGPSVFPKQPDGLWQAAFNGERTWMTSRGDDRYRRGLYTFWRRTIPYPSMAAFDAPSREVCQVKRVRSNTPIQAFVTLNDPVYVEAAQALARRIVKEGGWTSSERLQYGIKLCLGRPADQKQMAPLLKLFEQERQRYRQLSAEALKLATDPLGPLPKDWKPEDLAAWTVIANVLLNLDGVLMKG